jgi:hypothetical protein
MAQMTQALNATLGGAPFLGMQSNAEQGMSIDETGHYQISPSAGTLMFTSFLFVRDEQGSGRQDEAPCVAPLRNRRHSHDF